MSLLQDAYGSNYDAETKLSNITHAINIISNMIAHRQFMFKLDAYPNLWQHDHIPSSLVNKLVDRINKLNRHLVAKKLDIISNVEDRKLLPYFITNTAVEYFLISDNEFHRYYIVYITPTEIGTY